MITFNDIKNNQEINNYITQSDLSLKALGYTEHSFAHVTKVAYNAAYILESLGYSKRDIELAFLASVNSLMNLSGSSGVPSPFSSVLIKI